MFEQIHYYEPIKYLRVCGVVGWGGVDIYIYINFIMFSIRDAIKLYILTYVHFFHLLHFAASGHGKQFSSNGVRDLVMEIRAENRFEALLLRSGDLALICAHEGKEALRTGAAIGCE